MIALIALAFATTEPTSLYDFTMDSIDGKPVELKTYKGKVALIVNVASRCGNTPQYEGLQKLYAEYKDKGVVLLGFPANEFRGQEPGSNADIKEFCTKEYGVTFPMFSKIVVKGEETNPLYTWLIKNAPYHDDVEWNFAKFLVGKDGQVKARFNPKVQPNDPAIVAAIEKELAG